MSKTLNSAQTLGSTSKPYFGFGAVVDFAHRSSIRRNAGCPSLAPSWPLTWENARFLAMPVLLILLLTLGAAAQIPTRQALTEGIAHSQQLTASELDARIAQIAPGDFNSEIFLRFARRHSSVTAGNAPAIKTDVQRILAAATSLGDEATLQVVDAGLAESLSRAGVAASPALRLNSLTQLQLRASEAERQRAQEQITALRAQGQLIAAEKMRQQLVNSQRNQQLQLEYMTRRARLQTFLNILLFVCLVLTIALAWSLWRIIVARRHQALEDPLTGLKNRRFLQPFMEHETERLRRSGLTALVLIADIDLFKNVNDRWGHDVGDKALIQFSEILRKCMRNSDVVSRWGGEEFLIICPQSAEYDAEIICNRIRKHLQQTPIATPGDSTFHLTVSIGAALFSPTTLNEHWEAALARADQALYSVKKNGRDSWSLAPPHCELPSPIGVAAE